VGQNLIFFSELRGHQPRREKRTEEDERKDDVLEQRESDVPVPLCENDILAGLML
jgi:hypothetical protein